jgi:hypothetical protein
MKTFFLITVLIFASNTQAQNSSFPPKEAGKVNQYTSKTHQTLKVGDEIEIGLPYAGNIFVFITQQNLGVSADLSSSIVKVTEIEIIGNKKKGYKAYAKFKGYGALPVYINIEPAINSKEIIINQ